MTAATEREPPFVPFPGLGGPHRMTWAGALWPRALSGFDAQGVERIFRVDDGTSVLAICHWQVARKGPGALVLVHGLAGDARSPYVAGTARKAFAAGLHVVRLNVRNCGGTAHLTRSSYHGGLTDDVLAVARELAETDGVPRVHLAGFSLGGNHVLLLGARLGEEAPRWLRSIVALSPCVDFEAAARSLDAPGLLPAVYRRRFLASLATLRRERARLDGEELDDSELSRVRGIRAFDARFTAPEGGFRDVDDYYARASAGPRLSRLRVPSTLIAARDDPLIPFESVEHAVLGSRSAVRLLETQHGGHLGFLGRRRSAPRDPDRRWGENRLVQVALEAERRDGGRSC